MRVIACYLSEKATVGRNCNCMCMTARTDASNSDFALVLILPSSLTLSALRVLARDCQWAARLKTVVLVSFLAYY